MLLQQVFTTTLGFGLVGFLSFEIPRTMAFIGLRFEFLKFCDFLGSFFLFWGGREMRGCNLRKAFAISKQYEGTCIYLQAGLNASTTHLGLCKKGKTNRSQGLHFEMWRTTKRVSTAVRVCTIATPSRAQHYWVIAEVKRNLVSAGPEIPSDHS